MAVLRSQRRRFVKTDQISFENYRRRAPNARFDQFSDVKVYWLFNEMTNCYGLGRQLDLVDFATFCSVAPDK